MYRRIGKPIEKYPCLHEGVYALCVCCPKHKAYILWGACRQCPYNSDGAKLTDNPKCLYGHERGDIDEEN